MKKLITLFALLAVVFTATACHEGPVEKAGRKVDNAVDKVRDAAK